MSNIAQIGVTQLIRTADQTLDAVIEALEQAKDAAVATGQAVVNIGGRSADVVIEEMKTLKAEYVEALNRTAEAVTEPLP